MWGLCRCDALKHAVQTLSDFTLSLSHLLDICGMTLCVAHKVAALLRPPVPSPKAHRALPRRWVCLRWGAGTRSGSDWVSWHGRRANAGNKSVSLTRRLSSCDVPPCPHQFWTNKDVWEENRSHRGRCQGEMHLVSGEIRQDWEVHQGLLLFFLLFFLKFGAETLFKHKIWT